MLALIKPRGLKDADIFRGTVGGPDTPPSAWEVVVQEINSKGILKSRIYEFSSSDELPSQHALLGVKFRLDFRFDGTIHSKTLKKWTPAQEILEWINSIIRESEKKYDEATKNRPRSISPEILSDLKEDDDPPVLENYASPKQRRSKLSSDTENLVREASEQNYVNSIAGGSIGLAFCAFIGVVVGTVIADAEEENEDDGLLQDEYGRPVDFKARNRYYNAKYGKNGAVP